MDESRAEGALTLPSRGRLRAEVVIVLGLSLGQAAIYAAIRLIERYLAPAPIGSQTSTLNPSQSAINYVDLLIQVLRIGFSLMPVALALYLLSANGTGALKRLGLTGRGRVWWSDIGWGFGLAAAIGIPGLGLYAVGRALGQSVKLNTSGLPDQWWAAAILLLSAAAAAILEEVIVVGFLVTRLRDLRWSVPAVIIASALLRGCYHLYQGWPMALGNVVMGLVFAYVYVRRGRLAPLIVAHMLLDAVAFIGPEVIPAHVLEGLGIT
ncbi:CPBP family intramembrane glutamic endopeptidase [Demequina oxidasica]|uniref:CPBP family intramembrane glutamic endopeptidase n=1 Tax=Demequina oxidasica TaxID=676199 RepID=UPI0007807FFB|nr:type II CAAX endopeptidase family protein [Demequina oxidasica]